MPLTLAQIESLAPDQASLDAASKLTRPAKWSAIGRDPDERFLWGECQGSGSAPYRTSATLDGLGYRCSCPSRKFPCKHALALFWRYAEHPEQFPVGPPPGWVTEWLARRRPKPVAGGGPAKPSPRSIEATAAADPAESPPPAGAVRGARQRERTQASREASVLAALDELDQWITDQLTRGLAHFPTVAREQCRTVARRMADGKAPGLANRLDALPADLFNAPDTDRGDLLIERLGGLHLLAEAYRRQEGLPEGLRQDVRRLVGWTVKRDELLGDPAAPRVRAAWSCLGIRTEVEPDGIRRIETWLGRMGEGEPGFALLLDFVPAGGSASASFYPGEAFEAEAVFYPSAAPLRAVLEGRAPSRGPASLPPAEAIAAALSRYEALLARQPFIERWPVAVCGARIEELDGGGLVLADDAHALPLDPAQTDELIPLLDLDPVTLAGLWDGRQLHALAGATPLGAWYGR